MKRGPLVILLFACASHAAFASGNQPLYEGCYEVQSGDVETFATTLFTQEDGLLRQQGTFSVNLKNPSKNRPEGVSKKLKIKRGIVVGESAPLDANPLNVLHTLTNEDRSGIIVSGVGTLTSLVPTSPCVREVTEVLEDFLGIGLYEGLDPVESFIVVEGELNFCNGQNTFEVTEGKLCF